MDIITRNFFRFLRTSALHDEEELEPMSNFKWNRLEQMMKAQGVGKNDISSPATSSEAGKEKYSRTYRKIVQRERHAIDTNVASLNLLKMIVDTVSTMLNRGMMIKGLLQIGTFLREQGDKVDFVKLDNWLGKLRLRRMAQLQGSMLIAVFNFEQDEIPFVRRIEPAAYKLVLRSVVHTANDTAEEWHFRQSRSGFVTNNSTLLRRNLRRSLKYFVYAPIETVSNYFSNFARSLQEIEE